MCGVDRKQWKVFVRNTSVFTIGPLGHAPHPPWPDTNIYKRISETHILRHEARPGVATTPSHTFQKVLSLDPTGGLPSP